MGKKLFCSTDSPIRRERLAQLKKEYPEMTDRMLITAMEVASPDGEIPSIEVMRQYFKDTEAQREAVITLVGDNTNEYTESEIAVLSDIDTSAYLFDFNTHNQKISISTLSKFREAFQKQFNKLWDARHYDNITETKSKGKLNSSFLDFSNKDYIKVLTSAIVDRLAELQYTISISRNDSLGATMAVTVAGGKIRLSYNPDLLLKDGRRFDYILAHELVHTVTIGAIDNVVLGVATEEETSFVNELWEIIKDLNNNHDYYISFAKLSAYNQEQRAAYVKEAIANIMTDPKIQKDLSEIKTDDKDSFFSRLLHVLRTFLNKILGRDISNSYLEKIINTVGIHMQNATSFDSEGFVLTAFKKTKISKFHHEKIEGDIITDLAVKMYGSQSTGKPVIVGRKAIGNNVYQFYYDKESGDVNYFIVDTIKFTEAQYSQSVQRRDVLVDQSVLDEITAKVFPSTQQREDRVMLISKLFSLATDALIEDTNNPEVQTEQGRKRFIISHIFEILDAVKTEFDEANAEDDYQKTEFQKVNACWQELLSEVANVLYYTEGVSLSFQDMSAQELNHNEGEENGNEVDTRQEDEDSEYVIKDGWMIQARQLDLRDTLSQKVRRILHTIERVNRNGETEVDDLGFARYLDADYAHLKLLSELSKINTSEEFDSTLQSMIATNPWVANVKELLDSDEQLKAAFYHDLRKEFVPYWIQTGNKTSQVNTEPTVLYYMREWQYNQEQGNLLTKDSLYKADRTYSVEAAEKGLSEIDTIKSELNDGIDEEVIQDNLSVIRNLLNMIGIDFTEGTIEDALNKKKDNIHTLLGDLTTIFKGVSKGLDGNTNLTDEYKTAYTQIAEIFDDIPQGVTIASFREAGKTYQSFSNPSYLGRLLNGIKSANFQTYLQQEFGRYEQFFKEGEYRLDILRKLASNGKYRDLLDRKVVLHQDKKEFDDWTEFDYLQVMVTEFFSDPSNKTGERFAYYYLPLLSDAPSAEFIKFIRYTGTTEQKADGTYRTVEECIIPKLVDVVKQEIDRIDMCYEREEGIKAGTIKEIASFDKNGKKFQFFPALNTYKAANGNLFLDEYKRLQQISQDEADTFAEQTVSEVMVEGFTEFLAGVERIEEQNAAQLTLPKSQSDRTAALKEYFYNNALMYAQTVQLTTTDLAYYKNLNDFQKRYKEVYAMTQRLYTGTKYGRKTQKILSLKDYNIKSEVYELVKEALDNAVKEGRISSIDRDYIISQYDMMTAGDAQAYRSLSSYRSLMDMSGNWTKEMDDAYNRITAGTWDRADFDILWQSIKPFTFTQVGQDSKTSHGDIKVPLQYKTAEYLLLAIYGQMAQSLQQSDTLRAINDFMDGKNAAHQEVDLVIFESGVKVGNQGAIALPINGSYDEVMDALSTAVDGNSFNPEIVKVISTEDYGFQVQNPEHLLDHMEILGSQFRRLIDADLPDSAVFSIKGRNYTKQQIHDLYQEVLTENILESFQEVSEKFATPEAIEEALQHEMAGNSRYSEEERKACTLVERNGRKVFQIPLYDPIQYQRIQQLLNSIIKKAVTKQSIRRGTCAQVSSVGLTKELQVRYNDQNGNLIFTEEEFLHDVKKGTLKREDYKRLKQIKKDFKTYQDYRNTVTSESQAYWEVYLPAWARRFFPIIQGEEGNMDITKIPDELREAIGLRIPTEAKYSMQPIFVKGFLPQANGSAVMMPADIVKTTGSDFDFDKVYLYFKEFYIDKGLRQLYESQSPAEKQMWENREAENALLTAIFGDEFEDDLNDDTVPAGYKAWLSYMRENHKEELEQWTKEHSTIKAIRYDYSKSAQENSRKARNNAIIDIATAILTNPSVIAQVQKPGGFDEAKRVARLVNVISTASFKEIREFTGENNITLALSKLFSTKIEELDKLLEKVGTVRNPLSPLTQTYFHNQNANGGKMIGIYAVGNAAHATGEWVETIIKAPLTIFGKQYQKLDRMTTEEGHYLSDILAQFLAASVDNVKDPVLTALNQNGSTGDVTVFLARLGLSIQEIALLLTAPQGYGGKFADTELTQEKVAWATMISQQDTLSSQEHKNYMLALEQGDVNKANQLQQLAEERAKEQKTTAITQRQRTAYDAIVKGINILMANVQGYAAKLTGITQTGRGESLSSAAGPTLANNIVRYIRLEDQRAEQQNPEKLISSNLLDFDFLLDENYDIDTMRQHALKSGVPFLQVATKCGVVATRHLLERYFPQTKPRILDLLLNKETGLRSYINTDKISNDDFASIINDFFLDLYSYTLTSTDAFGGRNIEERKQNYIDLLANFPARYKELRIKYPELSNNALIKKLSVANIWGNQKIIFQDSANLSKRQKQIIGQDWTQLIVSDNPEIKQLGIDLFRYGQLSGLTFTGPQSYIQLAPNVVKRAVVDYLNGLDLLMDYDGLNVAPFVDQFVRNRLTEGRYTKIIVDKDKVIKEEGGRISIPAADSVLRKDVVYEDGTKKEYFRRVKFIAAETDRDDKGNGTIGFFKFVQLDLAHKKAIYEPTTPLGIRNVFREYYYGDENPTSVVGEISRTQMENPMGSNDTSRIDSLMQDYQNELTRLDKPETMGEGVPTEVPTDPITGEEIC